jgi:cytochrome P450
VAHNRQASPTAPFALVFCKALDELQPLILFYVDLLIQRLKDNAAQPQDMVAWYIWTTSDIIGDLITGESFHGLQDQYWHSWIEPIVEGLEAKVAVSTARRYGLDFLVQFLILKAMVEKFDRLFAYTKDKVGSRIERGTDRPDFMSYIMRNDKDGWQMSKAEIGANSDVLIVAGSEPTASFLSGATYYLCQHPQALKRVTAEVRDAINSDQVINITSANKLDYLLAVLNESMRLYPPAPGSIPRIIVNSDRIAGQWVPPGVSGCLWS